MDSRRPRGKAAAGGPVILRGRVLRELLTGAEPPSPHGRLVILAGAVLVLVFYAGWLGCAARSGAFWQARPPAPTPSE